MRVLLVSTSYPRDASDWRGAFMRHMVGALARLPATELAVWAPPGELPGNVTSVVPPADQQWLAKLMDAGGISHLMRRGGLRARLEPLRLLRRIGAGYRSYPDADIYHVNWLQCSLPLPRNLTPALITVLGNDMNLLKLPYMRGLLRRAMRRRKVAICPNAEWMREPLQEAFGDLAQIQPVSFGIDPRWYAVDRDNEAAAQPQRWLAVTRLTAAKLGPLFQWSKQHFANQARELHLFGPMQETIEVPDWVHYHGSASPAQLATDWFPRACGLITLSRHAEGRPQVMLEAMAAGLPIIASVLPAHCGIVFDDETGCLCDSNEVFDRALLEVEDAETNQRMGAAARRWAEREIGTWDDCAARYARIYRQLLDGA